MVDFSKRIAQLLVAWRWLAAAAGALVDTLRSQEHQVRALVSVIETSQQLGATAVQDKILSVVVNNVKSLFGCDTCVVYLRDLENLQEPVLKVAQAVTATPDAFSDFNPNVKRSLIGEVFEQKKARLVRDFQEHQPEDAVRKDKGLRGVMVAPLLAEDDVLGVIFVGDAAVGRYGEAQLRLFGMLSMQVGLAVRAMQLQRKTEALAVTDSLSGLYTHGYFQDHLASSLSPAA